MPRYSRLKADGLIYHVISRGNNKMAVFHDEGDYQKYLDIIKQYKRTISFELYHFCLMANHVHLLIKPEFDLSRLMHRINLSYAQYYKFKYRHIGHFWQDRFKSFIVSQDEYLLQCAKYIETNPVRTSVSVSVDDYPYSSYKYYTAVQRCDIITKNPLYDDFGRTDEEKRRHYIDFINDKEEVNLKITNTQFIASEEYINKISIALLNHKLKHKRGRPRKNRKELSCNLLSENDILRTVP